MNDANGSITAKICSFARAYHSNYCKDKIFDDYLAYDIMGKDEYERIGTLIHYNFDEAKIDTTLHPEKTVKRVTLLAEMTASLGEVMKHGFTFESIKTALYNHGFDIDEHMTPQKIQSAFFEGRDDNHSSKTN